MRESLAFSGGDVSGEYVGYDFEGAEAWSVSGGAGVSILIIEVKTDRRSRAKERGKEHEFLGLL